MADSAPLVWLDMEMSGLNAKSDLILEVAVILTDSQLNVLRDSNDKLSTEESHEAKFHKIIHVPSEDHEQQNILNTMDEWCKVHHGRSGLLDKISDKKFSDPLDKVRQDLSDFFTKWIPHEFKGKCVLAGNSVHADKAFFERDFPDITKEWLHYRIVDVSSFKEIIQRWYPSSPHRKFKKKLKHRALDDILESIAELHHYRKHFLK